MGGKTSTSTSGVSIPPSVLAQYNSVNAQAQQTAQTPFQQYGGQFVAPVNSQQQTGITNTNAAAEEAQPYYGAATSTLGSAQSGVNPINAAATGLAGASAEQVNAQPLTGQNINQYLSPYLGDVLGTTNALANQNNSIAQSGALGTAISSGAFGGDRTGRAAANLNQQNQLAEQATDANILNTGYNTALSTAQQQQGVNLGAAQANRTALGAAGSELASIGSTAYGEGANTASELGSLGTGAQTAGLAGAQAQIGAGTLQQQTQQAQDTAEYNQFLQQQSYPFQVDQFLANIAEGTGALSGSTTTTTQPGGFFSDKRLKHDIKKIGKLFDGQEIYSYKMHGDPRTHIGLIAQKVEKKHPEAVGLARGYKIVDYGKATQEAANRSHFAGGGLARRAYAYGGSPDLADILTAHEAMYGSSPGGSGAYGLGAGSIPRGGSQRVPAGTSSGAQLHPAQGPTQRPPTGMQNVTNLSNFGNTLAKDYQGVKGVASNAQGAYQQNQAESAMATTNQQIANDPTMQGLLGAAPDLSSGATAAAPIADDMSVMDDAAMFANRGGRFALGGASGGMPARPPMRPPGGLSAGAMPMMGNSGLAARPRGHASGGGPYSNDVGAGSTELSIPTASGSSGMGGLAAAPPPAQSGSSDPLASLDKYDPAMQGIMASTQGQIKFDDGGVVPPPIDSDVPTSIDIPDDQTNRTLPQPAAAPGGPSAGTQDAQDIASIASLVGTAAMFFSDKRLKHDIKKIGKLFDGQEIYSYKMHGDPRTHIGLIAQKVEKKHPEAVGLAGGYKTVDYGKATGPSANRGHFAEGGLARGYAAGERIGKDDGGSISDDSDPDLSPIAINPNDTKLGLAGASDTMLPEATVTGQRPDPVTYTGGVSAPLPAPANPTAPDAPRVPADAKPDKDTPSTWTKIMDGLHAAGLDKATNVVPLLTGLAAMGTAPTRHLGVALAAGLGAGAQAYLPAQQQAAEIQGKQIQNQMAGIGLQATRNAIGASQAPAPQAAPSAPQGPPPDDPAKLTAYYQSKYAVPPMTPQEAAGVKQAQLAAGYLKNPGIAQQAQTSVQNRIANQTFENQQAARAEHDQLYQQAVQTKDPALLAQLNAIHPFTGDQYEDKAGRIVNSRTGLPPLGGAAQTYTPEQLWEQWKTMASPTDTGAPARVPFSTFAKQNGITLPQGWQPPMTNGPAAPAPATKSPAAPMAPARPATVPGAITAGGAPIEPQYRLPPQPTIYQPQTEQTKKTWDTTIDKKAELLDDSRALTSSSAQGLAYVEAAKKLMQTPGVPTGLSAPAKVALSRVAQATGITPGTSATQNQELAKYLGNLAVQNFKQNFGARPAAKEFDIQMGELNPEATMTPTAINNLLDFNSRNLNYMLQTGHRAAEYSQKNGDPQQFYDWNNSHFPMSAAVNGPARPGQQASGTAEGATSTSKSGKPIVFKDGHWQYR